METLRWPRLKALLHAALSLEPKRQRDLVDSVVEPGLKAELISLLASHDASWDFIEPPRFGTVSALLGPTPGSALRPGDPVGNYRLVRLIGAGGMGRVYLAERADGQFTRQVAVKALRPTLESEEFIRRFHREQRILATLAHPNIAMLLDAGSLPDGNPYLVMEYVEGIPIDRYCRENLATVVEILSMFRRVCAAVSHAHAHRIVHCDLKPENILVTQEGEPKLLDFGVASLLDEEPSAGCAPRGRSPVTLGYASPEQLAGERVTTVTDVYALGAVLHRLLTGDSGQAARSVGDPGTWLAPSLATDRPGGARELRGDLDSIVLKALADDPEERYGSVRELAEDLDRFLAGQPVTSRAGGVAYRAKKLVARNRGSVAAAVALLGVLAAGAWGIATQAQRAADERARTQEVHLRLEAVNRFLEEMLEAPRPAEFGVDVTVREVLDRASTQLSDAFDEQPEVAATLRTTLGQSYLSLGLLDDAKRELQDALEIRQQAGNAEKRAKARNNLAAIRYHLRPGR